MTEIAPLTIDTLRTAVRRAAALRRRTILQPAGGAGDKVFPPTYPPAKASPHPYAWEERWTEQGLVPCVLLDSVQSQANRMEMALLAAWDQGKIPLPVIAVDFRDVPLPQRIRRVTSLEAPHRIADAILRDSQLNHGNKPIKFPAWLEQKGFNDFGPANATLVYQLNPTALVFGMWDSTGPRGGLGVKIQRALVSEVVGVDAHVGVRPSSRIDPLQIVVSAGPVYEMPDGRWTLDAKEAKQEKSKPARKGKEGKPSEVNHGNIKPELSSAGGITMKQAEQTFVLSFAALRRLTFPIGGKVSSEADEAARTALAALGVCAATLAEESGLDFRSRCVLVPDSASSWDILPANGGEPARYSVSAEEALRLLEAAVDAAIKAGLPSWPRRGGDDIGSLVLTPQPQLVELVRKSQELASKQSGED